MSYKFIVKNNIGSHHEISTLRSISGSTRIKKSGFGGPAMSDRHSPNSNSSKLENLLSGTGFSSFSGSVTGSISVRNVKQSISDPTQFLLEVSALHGDMEEEHVIQALINGLNQYGRGTFSIIAYSDFCRSWKRYTTDSFSFQSIYINESDFKEEHEIKMVPVSDSKLNPFVPASNDAAPIKRASSITIGLMHSIATQFFSDANKTGKWFTPKKPIKKGYYKEHQVSCYTLSDDTAEAKILAQRFSTLLVKQGYSAQVLTSKNGKPSVTVDLTESKEMTPGFTNLSMSDFRK